MSNMYRGMLLVPVRIRADTPDEGLAIAKSMSVRVTGMLRDDNSVYSDTSVETQASITVTPYATDIIDNVVSISKQPITDSLWKRGP